MTKVELGENNVGASRHERYSVRAYCRFGLAAALPCLKLVLSRYNVVMHVVGGVVLLVALLVSLAATLAVYPAIWKAIRDDLR
ncbi:MAG TPA: hypothetical protein VGF91_01960, partial [Solirubrobacteraceae bacterium]